MECQVRARHSGTLLESAGRLIIQVRSLIIIKVPLGLGSVTGTTSMAMLPLLLLLSTLLSATVAGAEVVACSDGETCALPDLSHPLLPAAPQPFDFCAVTRMCGTAALPGASELEQWDCVARFLWQPIPAGRQPTDFYYLEHDCHGNGFGNTFRAIYTAGALAMTFGRRLIVSHPVFRRLFDPPVEGTSSWNFGTNYPLFSPDHDTVRRCRPRAVGLRECVTCEGITERVWYRWRTTTWPMANIPII